MFPIRSQTPHPDRGTQTLDQTLPFPDETDEQRTARQLRVCHEAVELGMAIARRAAAAACAEWPENPHPPEPPAAPAPNPPPANPQHPGPQHPANAHPANPRPNRPRTLSPTIAFTRLIRAIRALIELESRIADRRSRATQKAAQAEHDRAERDRATPPPPAPVTPTYVSRPRLRPIVTETSEIPSILANIGQEIGVNLERQPSTGPPR